MKILMVSRWMWEERRRNNGKPGFFGELAQAIVAKGVDLTILSQASDAGANPEARPVDGLDLHVFSRDGRNPMLAPADKIIKWWSGYRKALTDAVVIRRFVREKGPFDAVVAQCEEPDGLACALAAGLGRFPPLITHVHDLRYRFESNGFRFVGKSSLGFIFRKSVRVVANSPQTAEWLQREYGVPLEKIGQCRIHLTAPFLRAVSGRSAENDRGDERILFLGALNRKKGPDIFLRAAALLAPELPGWIFVMAGPETSADDSFRAMLKNLASDPLLAGRVEWLGRLENVLVIKEVLRARVVVCPSRIETFSRTTVEALALGRPVVVSETTGAAAWVRTIGGGSVIQPNDPDALARAILEWTSGQKDITAPALIISQLSVSAAADDWIREVNRTINGIPLFT